MARDLGWFNRRVLFGLIPLWFVFYFLGPSTGLCGDHLVRIASEGFGGSWFTHLSLRAIMDLYLCITVSSLGFGQTQWLRGSVRGLYSLIPFLYYSFLSYFNILVGQICHEI